MTLIVTRSDLTLPCPVLTDTQQIISEMTVHATWPLVSAARKESM